ncbi:PIG-L family deacetylase [Streptomyces sp. LP05-1]|uniref:PIG-L family deacetylase n=1 Tax=Streptomyces pyxinae TaxID=2970734 RepID=A0ABT2CNB9_9ACTN|nr:PIG-L family deacetylase [Streptomyces sp. LP05-1]MCS0638917.1 PIG-L family deacetylase [Streptomyces sp. LP05-1]
MPEQPEQSAPAPDLAADPARRPSRRRLRRALVVAAPLAVLLGVTGGALVATSGSSDASDVPSRGVPENVAVRPIRTDDSSVVQIVSHPDDDLYFMNPDTRQSLVSGRSLTTVYLTAGESDGRNARHQDPQPRPDKPGYAEARQNGIRAAYAEMATGNRTSPWDRTAVTTAGGARAELDTLRARPQISLVWVQLRETGSISDKRPFGLRALWDGEARVLESQLAAGSPVRKNFAYGRQQLTDTLAGLLRRFRPTFVRLLDPTPGRIERTGKLADHQDHMYGARFAQAALAEYARTPGRPSFGVQHYLGYFTGGLPHSLDPASSAAKLATLKTYAWSDGEDHCEDPAGCGDLKVAANPTGHGWSQSIRYSRGESTSWVQPGAAGGLYAFSVLDGRLAVWRKAPGHDWAGPVLQNGAGQLDSGVTSVRLPDGRIGVFGVRTQLGEADGYRREVVLTLQTAPGGPFGGWQSLGTPERDDESGTSDISLPAVLVDRTGRMAAYVRNGAHTMSLAEQRPDGTWSGWLPVGGEDLHGDPVAVTDRTGLGHVFATTPATVLTWTRPATGGATAGPLETGLPATTLSLSAEPDGRDGVRLWFRKPASGEPRWARLTGRSPASPVRGVPGVSGYGAIGAASGRLALRAPDGTLALTGTPGASTPAGTPGTGSPAGSPARPLGARLFSGAPAPAPGGFAAMGLDGHLEWVPTGR